MYRMEGSMGSWFTDRYVWIVWLDGSSLMDATDRLNLGSHGWMVVGWINGWIKWMDRWVYLYIYIDGWLILS